MAGDAEGAQLRMSAKAGVGALGLLLLVILVALALMNSDRRPATATPSEQPINFPHHVHAGTYRIDCQYCHADARRSEYAGLPSVTRCMGCHKITAGDKPEIKKLAQYAGKGEPVPWARAYKLPEFTHFAHKAHIHAGLRCQTCHGPDETMTTVGARTGQQR